MVVICHRSILSLFIMAIEGSPQRLSWEDFGKRITKLQELVEQIKSAPPFQFVEVLLERYLWNPFETFAAVQLDRLSK
jgi:hypothetical protein